MKFFGREREIAELASALNSPGFEAMLLYGHRRVGKTVLIQQALTETQDGALVISCECKRASAGVNLRLISAKVATALGYPADYIFPSFDAIIENVFAAALDKKIVLVIDEFSFLLKEDSAIDSSLSIAIDAHRHDSNLKIILAGSYIDLMKGLVDASAPLYGRFTHIINLQPLDYYTASLFYPSYTAADKVLMYAAFGGVPYFNALINPNRSAIENILELIVREGSILEHEINEMLLGETSKIESLNTVIELVGTGVCKYTDIAARLSQDKTTRPQYALARLQDMGILRKIEPINAKGNKKRTFYAFADNLVHFYYRYVFHYLAERNTMTPQDFFAEFVEDDLRRIYLPLKFEGVAAEGIARLSRLHRISPIVYEVGTYSYDDQKAHVNRQFDVVTRDAMGYTSYECKFTDAPVGIGIVTEEEVQIKDAGIDIYRLGFISKSGFTPDVDAEKYMLLTIEDLYAEA